MSFLRPYGLGESGSSEEPVFGLGESGSNEEPVLGLGESGSNEEPVLGLGESGSNEEPVFGLGESGNREEPVRADIPMAIFVAATMNIATRIDTNRLTLRFVVEDFDI